MLKKKELIYIAFTLIVTGIMTGSAELFNNNEIIFPEIGAIAVGLFLAPKRSWQVSKTRLLIFIGICSVSGILIVNFVPLPKYIQMITGFLLCQIIFVFSRTSFAPMISATVLPILLGTESIVYPIAAVCLTLLIIGFAVILDKTGIRDYGEFSPLPYPDKKQFINVGIRLLIASAVIIPAIISDFRFMVAPPLLVAFTEFSNPESGGRKHPIKAIAIVTICSLSGTVIKYLTVILFSLPTTISAVMAMLLVAVIMYSFKMFIPPAGALAILPSIVPDNQLLMYPLEIFCGVTLFMIFSILVFKKSLIK